MEFVSRKMREALNAINALEVKVAQLEATNKALREQLLDDKTEHLREIGSIKEVYGKLEFQLRTQVKDYAKFMICEPQVAAALTRKEVDVLLGQHSLEELKEKYPEVD